VDSGVFFFQAEDGIRDFHVTGVQTCALPISLPPSKGRKRASAVPPLLTGSQYRRPSRRRYRTPSPQVPLTAGAVRLVAGRPGMGEAKDPAGPCSLGARSLGRALPSLRFPSSHFHLRLY